MGLLKSSSIVYVVVLFSLFSASALASKKSYIVYLGSHSHGYGATEADYDAVTDSHFKFLSSFVGSQEKAKESIFQSYKRNINGFAAFLDEEEAAKIAKHPSVVSVFLNKQNKLHTTRSWGFLMLEDSNEAVLPGSLWEKARFGEDTIIGNIDTGVWPTSKSFSDHGYGPIPSRWKGTCQNATEGFHCNRKLIGARYFNTGLAAFSVLNETDNTPLDREGHGTHTLSTAGGNFVPGASIQGVGNGTAKGGSPRARVAAYKVCWPSEDGEGGCFDSDILAAFEAAIEDGVDVISGSLGGPPTNYLQDAISIGSFHAIKKGIVVVCSAGNEGPTAQTVSNISPWIITVAASTLDRNFVAEVKLKNGKSIKGESLSPALDDQFYPLITGDMAVKSGYSPSEALLCTPNTLDPAKVKGKILVCLRGENARVEKGGQAKLAGAVGMILCNDEGNANDIVADPHIIPASHVTYKDGLSLFAYINSTKNPLATLVPPKAEIDAKPAPVMAAFSSVGPNSITADILKPDITAPGVNVIAAFSEAVSPTDLPYDRRRIPFNTMSGTSMSCPHVAGIAGLLKTLHPRWSPAAIRSAIVTTAHTRDNTRHPMMDASHAKATPFQYGHGHIRPNRAMDPGLVYDLNVTDYLDLLCSFGIIESVVQRLSENTDYQCPTKIVSVYDFNYPSFTVANLNGSATLNRKVTNVGPPGVYTASFVAPEGVLMTVEPKVLEFKSVGEVKKFSVTLTVKGPHTLQGYEFGRVKWSDGKRYVRSPVVVNSDIN